MKNSLEMYNDSRDKFTVQLRKEKRTEYYMKKRGKFIKNFKLNEAEKKLILEEFVAYIVEEASCRGKTLQVVEIKVWNAEVMLRLLDLYSLEINLDDFRVLNFFSILSQRKEDCELLVKNKFLHGLVDLLGNSDQVIEILKILLEICENYSEAAYKLVKLGLFEDIKRLFKDDPLNIEVYSYVVYRVFVHTHNKVEAATLPIVASLCKSQLETSNEKTKLYVYHTINILLHSKDHENLCKFVIKYIIKDIKNPKYQNILLDIAINLTCGPDKLSQKLLELSFLDNLQSLMKISCNFQLKVVMILANMVDSGALSKTFIVASVVYKEILALIDSPNYEVKKETGRFFESLSKNAEQLLLSLVLDQKLFVKISQVLEDQEICMEYLAFFNNVFKKRLFLRGVRENFEGSGCFDKLSKLACGKKFALQVEYVLKKYENYIG